MCNLEHGYKVPTDSPVMFNGKRSLAGNDEVQLVFEWVTGRVRYDRGGQLAPKLNDFNGEGRFSTKVPAKTLKNSERMTS